MSDIKFRFLCVEIITGGPCSKAKVISQRVYDSKFSTLIKARDELIREARTQYTKDFYTPGDDGYEPASEAISKFPFKDLVGYYHLDEGLTFLFREDSPVFKPIVEGKIAGTELAERLIDLFDHYYDKHEATEYA